MGVKNCLMRLTALAMQLAGSIKNRSCTTRPKLQHHEQGG